MTWEVDVVGEVVVIQLPLDSPLLATLVGARDGRIVWKLG